MNLKKAKEELSEFGNLIWLYRIKTEEFERISAKAELATSSYGTHRLAKGGGIYDTALIKLSDYLSELEAASQEINNKRKELEKRISGLGYPYSMILYYRFIAQQSIKDIMKKLNYSEPHIRKLLNDSVKIYANTYCDYQAGN